MHTAQAGVGAVPPVKLRNLEGESVDVDLRGVTTVEELRDCIAHLKEVLPSEVKLLSKDNKDLSDGFVLLDLLDKTNVTTTNGFVDVQVVITRSNQKHVESDVARRLGSTPGEMANLTKIDYPFVKADHCQDMFAVMQNSALEQEMTQLPNSIADMIGLECLDVTGHALRHLPPRVGELSNLTILKLGSNALKRLPNSIGCLLKLKTCELQNNKLIMLPESFGSLRKLKRLNLESNMLSGFPETFPELKALQILNIKGNPLQFLPDGFERLSLISLDIDVDLEPFQLDQRIEFVRHLPRHVQRWPAFNAYREPAFWCPCSRRAKREERTAREVVRKSLSPAPKNSVHSMVNAEDQKIFSACMSMSHSESLNFRAPAPATATSPTPEFAALLGTATVDFVAPAASPALAPVQCDPAPDLASPCPSRQPPELVLPAVPGKTWV